MEKVKFQVPDSEEVAEFYIIDQTKINGQNYILVAEEEDDDCDAFILKEISSETDAEASYEMVESEEELEYMLKIFMSMLDDVDIIM